MLRCNPLPLSLALGQSTRNINQKAFHKSHHFDVINSDVQVLAEAVRPGIGGKPLFKTSQHATPSLYPSQQGSLLPAWLLYDQKVLCFFGYFKETLPDVYRASFQIRKVKIFFYLEDETIQVSEPKCVNSGIAQGCLISRQRVPLSSGCGFVSILDFNVNQTVRLFDRVYVITDCDLQTRNFLNRQGIAVPDPIDIPKDPSTELRKLQETQTKPKRVDTLGKFLKNDRKVLRFGGYWDDTNSESGDIRQLEVLYHLSDNTIEVKEKLTDNCGRDSNGMFLKRMKIPKEGTQMPRIGSQSFTILNVLGKSLRGGRYLQDCLDSGNNNISYYQENDLSIGCIINIYGRIVTLTDCDKFTQSYYQEKYGVEEFQPIKIPAKSPKLFNDRVLPPFNGWGSHEDSEVQFKSIELKPPHIDFKKFINYDKVILRFGAKMKSTIKENNERVFVINYYLSDDTLSVHEIARRNSGFLGGEFFKRAKFLLPGQGSLYTSNRPKIYQSHHFFLGSKVILRDYFFEIISVDTFALNFMEQHNENYPMHNPTMILAKVRDRLKPIYKDFIARYMTKVKSENTDVGLEEFMSYSDFKNLLLELFGDDIVEQEIVTLCRYFSIKSHHNPQIYRENIRSLIHQEIYRHIWDDLTCLKEFIYHLDPEGHEYLPEKVLRTILRGSRVPLEVSVIDQLFTVLKRNACDEILVKDFVDYLDQRKGFGFSKVPDKKQVISKVLDIGSIIDWKKFIRVLDLESDLRQAGT